MKSLQFGLFALKSVQELKKFITYNNNSSLIKNSKMIVYNSELVGNVQLSIEILYDYLGRNNKLQYLPIIIMEGIKAGLRFKEFMDLYKIGYTFYIDKAVFYNQVLMVSEEEYLSKLSLSESEVNSYLSIKPNKSNIFIPISNTSIIEIPSQLEKYSSLKHNSLVKQDRTSVIIWTKCIAEVLFLIRPGVYVLLLFTFNDTPYVALLASAIIDGVILLTQKYNTMTSFTNKRIYFHEKEYRVMRLWVYLMREPIYSKITLKMITKITNILPSFIQSFFLSLLDYYRKIYFIA